jgi:hypothetical protein
MDVFVPLGIGYIPGGTDNSDGVALVDELPRLDENFVEMSAVGVQLSAIGVDRAGQQNEYERQE